MKVLGTAFTKSLSPNISEAQDYFVEVPTTEGQEVHQPLGFPPLFALPVPPAVGAQLGMPPHFQDLWAQRAREPQKHLTYKIGALDRGSFWADPILVRSSLELQPIWNQRDLLQRRVRAALVPMEHNKIRTSEVPSGQYADFKCRILNEVQRHFLEPVIDNGQTWQLWTAAEVHEALELRLYRFLMETGMLREESSSKDPNSASIPQDSLEVRRVEWKSGSSSRGLQRMDAKQADLGYPGWDSSTSSAPVGYIEEPSVDSMVLKSCPPASVGTLSMRYVPAPSLNAIDLCEAMPIPRMFTWVVKWGLIGDLLKKEGEANDPVRAEAALKIYSLGVTIARLLLGTRS